MNHTYSKISIVVPSYNQGNYLEETLLSIINQNYPNIELIVIDGGSTDNSVAIIKKYENYIYYWVSEHDNGQSHAINKGIAKATGEWIAWMNSDDCYLPGAFDYLFKENNFSDYDFLYGNTLCGSSIKDSWEGNYSDSTRKELKDILLFFYHEKHIIPSQSAFVKREILDRAGLINEALKYCMDLDWFCRIYIATNKRFFYVKPISFFRFNENAKSGNNVIAMKEEAITVAEYYMDCIPYSKQRALQQLITYYKALLQEMKQPKQSLFRLIKLGFKFPLQAWRHISFKTLLKQSLL